MPIKKKRKAYGINKPLELDKYFLQKNSKVSYFPTGSSCQPCLVQANFFGCMKRQHAVFLESFWEKRLDHYSFSRLTDGTPYSSSDLFTSLSILLGQNYSMSISLLTFAFFDKNFPSPNLSSLFSPDKNLLSPTSLFQKKTIPNSALATKSSQSRKNILSKSHFLSDLENFTLSAYELYTLAAGV